MKHVFWIVPGKLAGRAGPAVDPWNLEAIAKGGITTIVSVDEDCQPESVAKAGLKHIQKFMPSAFPTNPALVERFAELTHDAVQAVLEEIRAGGQVLVHCYAGRDRSGLVLCGTLMELEGLNAKAALARVRVVRPVALTGPGVIDVLAEYELRRESGVY